MEDQAVKHTLLPSVKKIWGELRLDCRFNLCFLFLYSSIKRGLDLGLGRSFSGSQAAKHMMGLAAANLAAGPGKKKRFFAPRRTGMEEEGVGPSSSSNDWAEESQK